MITKKQFILLLIAFLLLCIVPLGLWMFSFLLPQTEVTIPPVITAPTPIIPLTQTPEGKIIIDGVRMNDFTKSPKKINTEKDIFFIDNPSYQITYLSQFNQFLISINSSPFETYRKDAEKEFTKALGITEAEACTLDVTVGSPIFINPDQVGKNYRLSFCE